MLSTMIKIDSEVTSDLLKISHINLININTIPSTEYSLEIFKCDDEADLN